MAKQVKNKHRTVPVIEANISALRLKMATERDPTKYNNLNGKILKLSKELQDAKKQSWLAM